MPGLKGTQPSRHLSSHHVPDTTNDYDDDYSSSSSAQLEAAKAPFLLNAGGSQNCGILLDTNRKQNPSPEPRDARVCACALARANVPCRQSCVRRMRYGTTSSTGP